MNLSSRIENFSQRGEREKKIADFLQNLLSSVKIEMKMNRIRFESRKAVKLKNDTASSTLADELAAIRKAMESDDPDNEIFMRLDSQAKGEISRTIAAMKGKEDINVPENEIIQGKVAELDTIIKQFEYLIRSKRDITHESLVKLLKSFIGASHSFSKVEDELSEDGLGTMKYSYMPVENKVNFGLNLVSKDSDQYLRLVVLKDDTSKEGWKIGYSKLFYRESKVI